MAHSKHVALSDSLQRTPEKIWPNYLLYVSRYKKKHSLSLAKLLRCQSIYLKNKVLFSVSFQIQLHKWKITHVWSRWGKPQNFLLEFIDELWKTWKIRILKNEKKIAGDVIILHVCTKSYNHMKYSSWDKELDRIFLSFWAIFCPFIPHPLTTQKIKILKKWKKNLQISSFQTCATKNTIIWCMLTQIWSATDIIFCHLRPFFAILPHYWPWKLKFGKNKKKLVEVLSFYTCVPQIKIIWCMVPEI